MSAAVCDFVTATVAELILKILVICVKKLDIIPDPDFFKIHIIFNHNITFTFICY